MNDGGGMVDLCFCIGADCLRLHGVRLATRRGIGYCSIYIVCDECFIERLTSEEREHMVEVDGVDRVRELGLHELHWGQLPPRLGEWLPSLPTEGRGPG